MRFRLTTSILSFLCGCWSTTICAQPLQVRPQETVHFYLCFYYEDVPGNPPAVNQNMVLQPQVHAQSGYHAHHDASRPIGTLIPSHFTTAGDGCSPAMTYIAPRPAGTYPILIIGSGTTNTQEIWVGAWVDNGACCVQLYENADMFYKPTGPQPEHPGWYQFNVSVPTVAKMQHIAQLYHQQTGTRLCVNDMSLNWGGVFDLGPRYEGTFWQPPRHSEHTLGLNVDLPFSCNSSVYRQTMYSIAASNGGGDGGPILDEGDHYHLRFLG